MTEKGKISVDFQAEFIHRNNRIRYFFHFITKILVDF